LFEASRFTAGPRPGSPWSAEPMWVTPSPPIELIPAWASSSVDTSAKPRGPSTAPALLEGVRLQTSIPAPTGICPVLSPATGEDHLPACRRTRRRLARRCLMVPVRHHSGLQAHRIVDPVERAVAGRGGFATHTLGAGRWRTGDQRHAVAAAAAGSSGVLEGVIRPTGVWIGESTSMAIREGRWRRRGASQALLAAVVRFESSCGGSWPRFDEPATTQDLSDTPPHGCWREGGDDGAAAGTPLELLERLSRAAIESNSRGQHGRG